MSFTEKANKIFNQAIRDYHLKDDVDTPINNPYERDTIEYSLYLKCWIDTVQWHLEDIIRDPHINPTEALGLKRRIDRSNQDRTDLVEEVDTYFRKVYADVKPQAGARLNTESPAWAIDRLSILALKIWHMKEQTERKDADAEHIQKCQGKLGVLLEQQVDLSTAIDQLLEDIEAGRKYMKVYRQMKMYNDPATNPVLYKNSQQQFATPPSACRGLLTANMKKEHILVIRFSAMGDVAMMVPVVYSLAHQYPDIRITVLSRAFARPFFEDLAPNVGFMVADLKNEYKGIKGLNALYRRLAAKQFTAVADLHSVLRSNYLRMRFNLGRYRVEHINKHRKGRRSITSPTHKELVQQPTSFQNYVDVFAKLGYPVEIQFKSIFPDEGGNLNMLPPGLCVKKSYEQWIGVAPFAAHEGKTYPPRLMLQVIEQLMEKYPKARILLFGRGEKESKYFAEWSAQHAACVNVGAQLESMHQELILMSHLDVMISMDSSNMHLASLTHTPETIVEKVEKVLRVKSEK